jgi:hypothetical protein
MRRKVLDSAMRGKTVILTFTKTKPVDRRRKRLQREKLQQGAKSAPKPEPNESFVSWTKPSSNKVAFRRLHATDYEHAAPQARMGDKRGTHARTR